MKAKDQDGTYQRDVFAEVEGDRYYERNKRELEAASLSFPAERLIDHISEHSRSRVLEVGCALGNNLAALQKRRSIDAFGVDPSRKAVDAGLASFPDLKLQVATADDLPFPTASMDVVWFGFCLYLVDRQLLQRTVAEADRVLRDGGLIAIHDFDPLAPCARPYVHREGVNSYKMDYSKLFLSNPAYTLVEKHSFSHTGRAWVVAEQDRLAVWIIRKSVQAGYVVLK